MIEINIIIVEKTFVVIIYNTTIEEISTKEYRDHLASK